MLGTLEVPVGLDLERHSEDCHGSGMIVVRVECAHDEVGHIIYKYRVVREIFTGSVVVWGEHDVCKWQS